MTILRELARLTINKIKNTQNFFTSNYCLAATKQLEEMVLDETVNDELMVNIAISVHKSVSTSANFLGMPVFGRDAFLTEVGHFISQAQHILIDRNELIQNENIIRKLALSALLAIHQHDQTSPKMDGYISWWAFENIVCSADTSDYDIFNAGVKLKNNLEKKLDSNETSFACLQLDRFLEEVSLVVKYREDALQNKHGTENTTIKLLKNGLGLSSQAVKDEKQTIQQQICSSQQAVDMAKMKLKTPTLFAKWPPLYQLSLEYCEELDNSHDTEQLSTAVCK